MPGPAERELTCDQCFQELNRYVELEHADGAIPGLRTHLEGCPACREDHDSLLAYLMPNRPDAALGRTRSYVSAKRPHAVIATAISLPETRHPSSRHATASSSTMARQGSECRFHERPATT